MKNTSRKPYIYKVTNLETHQYYIGSQCSGKTVGVNYFTSSTNKAFKNGFKTYGEEKYKIKIIKEFDDPKKCGRAENYVIRNYMLLKDGLCLNKFCCCGGEKIFSMIGTHHSEETRKKLSIAHKGQPAWNKGLPSPKKGIPRSEETKQKIRKTKKDIPLSEEARQKIITARKGIHLSEETRKRISEAQQGRPSPRRIKISIEGTIFDSITEASKYYNKGKDTIRNWVKKNQHNAFYVEK